MIVISNSEKRSYFVKIIKKKEKYFCSNNRHTNKQTNKLEYKKNPIRRRCIGVEV